MTVHGSFSLRSKGSITPIPTPPPKSKLIPRNEITVLSVITNLITGFTRYTQAHGFGHFHRSRIYGWRVAWTFMVIAIAFSAAGLVLGFMQIQQMLQPGFYNSQVQAVLETSSGLTLPRFSLTNAGFFNYSKLVEFDVTPYEASLISAVMIGKLAFTKLLVQNVNEANRDYHALLTRLNTTERDIWSKLSYRCDEIIMDCVLQHEYIPGTLCCEKYFTTVLGNLGLSFVASSDITQDRETVSAGLSLALRVPVQPLSLDWGYMNHRATVLQGGLRFNILGDDKSYDSEVSSLVPVTGKERTMVALSYTKHDNTGLYQSLVPWDQSLTCIPYTAPYEERAQVGRNCHSSSVHNCARQLRNCVLVNYPFWNGVERICDLEDIVYLMVTVVNASLECQQNYYDACGSACFDHAYTYSTQNTPLLYIKEDTSNTNWYVEGAFTMFYAKLSYTLFSQTRSSIMTMLSAVGGQVGMFMGGSFITLIEFCIVSVCIFVCTTVHMIKRFTK